MSKDDNSYISTSTKTNRLRSVTRIASSRVTRSQFEQHNKLKALYAESHNTGPTTVTVTQSKENVNENYQSSDSSMIPIESKEERDDSKSGNNSAVTLSPNAEKGGDHDNKNDNDVVANTPTSPSSKEKVESADARAARRAAWPLKGITEPGENDCLFGRGGGTNHHPGNKRYRKLVEDRKETYLKSKRLDKPLVAMGIINDWRALDPPGRFLKQDDKTKYWDDVGDKKAREKTSQALREKTPVKQREGEEYHHPRDQRIARFEPGTSSPVARVKRVNLARDHSLGETFVGGNELSLEGFSWDDSDNPVVRNENANVSPPVHHQGGHYAGEYHHHNEHPPPPHGEHRPPPYDYIREHSLSTNPLSNATVSHSAPPAFGEQPPHYRGQRGEPSSYYGHHYPGYGSPPPGYGSPPPPPGHGPPPPPPDHGAPPPYHHSHPPPYSSPRNPPPPPNYPHHQQPQPRSREHSLQMNPLKGGSTSKPARDTFAEEESYASYSSGHRPPPHPSPAYDNHGAPPPPLPPPYYGYGTPSPQHGWPTPPQGHPSPQFSYHPGSNTSAFGRYDSEARSNSLKSLGSSVDAYYDRRDSGASSAVSSDRYSRQGSSSAPPSENPGSAGTSQDYSKIAELIRDSSDKTRSNSMDDSNAGKSAGYEDTIPRSKSMPYEDSPRMSGMEGRKEEDVSNPDAASSLRVQKPSLLRKLSGGAMARPVAVLAPVVRPIDGGSVHRPEPVKRDTSNQPETLETKRSIKRVVLSRDQSAVSRRLKEEQNMRPGSRLSLTRAQLLDRKLSVEINKLGLEDRNSALSLDRMTTDDVLASLIDDDGEDQFGSPSSAQPPKRLGEDERVTTIDTIAIDIHRGNNPSLGDWDDALEMINEPAPVVHTLRTGESAGVSTDIAEKWLKGET
eukprot:CAMPEP_0196135996 /NCGR_PEP_ID=MMETSP0910-20130528/4449_1 /TAXON_ID=49265 /ORGANISM="Thalassiosira rotula, Strain GSO102" /LENGTH=901 /DNA_ID=CAMNT_0041396205 /DNA_START=292 /DNA_END=2997 /DNA_ORIENTATION=-